MVQIGPISRSVPVRTSRADFKNIAWEDEERIDHPIYYINMNSATALKVYNDETYYVIATIRKEGETPICGVIQKIENQLSLMDEQMTVKMSEIIIHLLSILSVTNLEEKMKITKIYTQQFNVINTVKMKNLNDIQTGVQSQQETLQHRRRVDCVPQKFYEGSIEAEMLGVDLALNLL